MRIIVTGATGLAGAEVVRQAIVDAAVPRITALSRRPLGVADAKLEVVLHEDFTDYAALLPRLAEHDAVLWCLGVAQGKVTAEEYERITFDYAVAAARAMASANAGATFCFLSGGGADSSERSRIRFARVKGRTENELLRISSRAYCFRPGYIRPSTPPPGRPWLARAFDALAPALQRISSGLAIDADVLARAMLGVARRGAPKRVLENADILAIQP